jgi:hydrogenase maturation protein HypF
VLDVFERELVERAPPLAQPKVRGVTPCEAPARRVFEIAPSSAAEEPEVSVPPDFFACDECVKELADPADRRHAYPFINCTQCGPRYTLIEALPYDRPNTSMAHFPLCPECRREYEDPLDRRFHAEPVACPVCGPHLTFVLPGGDAVTGDAAAVAAAVRALRDGRVLAVRGIGGYHLLCDARSETAVRRLRERKRRPDKPLAVMFPQRGADGLDAAREDLEIGPAERQALRDPARAIVLVTRRADSGLAPAVAPGLAEIGAFLPYSPLHHLLLAALGGPVVATSGNVSGEPVLTDPQEAELRLASVADAFLHHDRPIVRPADDSVVRIAVGRARPIRLGRGVAPLELELPGELPEPVLAVGGHLKLTVALAWGRRVVVSPHVGDMGTRRS